jgi:AcrR family transcriptional regulator
MTGSEAPARRRNPRGQGEQLRAEIVGAAARLLNELGDDQALSMRAVARAVGVAATSVYPHFADRDALVLAVMAACHQQLLAAAERGEAGHRDPARRLRAHLLAQIDWALDHPGLYKVLHESGVNRRAAQPYKQALLDRTTDAVRACLGDPDAADAATIAFDLRTAVNGMLSVRVNEATRDWPPPRQQLDRFIAGLLRAG